MSENGELNLTLYQNDIHVTTFGLPRQSDGMVKSHSVAMYLLSEPKYWVNIQILPYPPYGKVKGWMRFVKNIVIIFLKEPVRIVPHGRHTRVSSNA